MAKSRKAVEDKMRRHILELWLLVQDWYEVQGVKIDTADGKHVTQHYGSATFGRTVSDSHGSWKGVLFNSASLTLRNPFPGKEPGDAYIDIRLRSDELYSALERHGKKNGKKNGKNMEV